MRCPADKIGGRWRDRNDICFPGEANVVERMARTEYLGVHRTSGYRFERYRSHELARGASHYHIDFSARLCKQTRQPH